MLLKEFFYFIGGWTWECIRLIKERVFFFGFNLYKKKKGTFVKEAPKGPNYMKIVKTNIKKEKKKKEE